MLNFPLLITDWYKRNKRDLPWRKTKDPYLIWLSEIILQQTRVDQGLSYYLKFVEQFPNVESLANADEQDVLTLWQGLGYYSRARNLHYTAQDIVKNHRGIFPTSYDKLIKLKGVGPYTAAAIASFSSNEAKAVVDGNVYRVLSRFFDVDLAIDSSQGQKYFQKLADELLPAEHAGIYNQSIMEFGALHCTPKNPDCANCELADGCLAQHNKTMSIRPVKQGKIKIKRRFFNYLLFLKNNELIVQKRENKDIWQHLFEFPLIELTEEKNDPILVEAQIKADFGLQALKHIELRKHVLSHQHLFARVWIMEDFPIVQGNKFQKIRLEEIPDFPLPRLLDKFIEDYPELFISS